MELEKLLEKAKKSDAEEMLATIEKTQKILERGRKDEALLQIPPKGNAIIVGDLHGDLQSLFLVLEHSKFLEKKDYIVFLGDYGDRGPYSPEVYYTVLSLKEEFSRRVLLLRGNHEFPEGLFVHPHDLPLRFFEKYGKEGEEIYERIKKLWDYFYVGAIVKGKYLFIHAGLPVESSSLKDIALSPKLHPSKSFLEEILWSDPFEGEGFFPSPRGAGRLFGKDVTKRVLSLIKVKTMIRSHQPPLEGIEVNHDGLILTISSTKVYGGKAAYLSLNLAEKAMDAYELSKMSVVF